MAKLNDLIVTGDTKMLGKLHANADTATTASSIFDSGDNSILTIKRSAAALSNPAYLAGWNGNELRAVNRSDLISGFSDLLALHNKLTTNTTRSTAQSEWGGAVNNLSYVWGQRWKDTAISSDTGDLQLGLRASEYSSGGTELCMMIDGDYYAMGKKVLHEGNYNLYALPLTGGTVTGTLILSNKNDVALDKNNSPALIIGGTPTTSHIEIDDNEIMAKSNATAATSLYLNADGGKVYIGSGGLDVGSTGISTNGSVTAKTLSLTGDGVFSGNSNYSNALLKFNARNQNAVTSRHYFPWISGQDGVNGQGYITTAVMGLFHGTPADAGIYLGLSWDGNNSDTIYYFRRDGILETPKLFVGGSSNSSYALATPSFICDSWVRTKNSTGWYNETHGGGWYMNDGTYVRSYNSKSVVVGNNIYVGTSAGGGTGLALYSTSAPTVYGIHMSTTGNYNKHGDVQSDWATYFNMNAVGQRGWIFRAGDTNVASISCNGIGTFSSVGNGDSYIAYPSGGSYKNGIPGTTGYLTITLPAAAYNSATMVRFKVSIFNYVASTSVDYLISGYVYTNGDWYNVTATCLGRKGQSLSNLKVRFGRSNTNNYVYIGESTTVWEYPNVEISDVHVGHAGSYNQWNKGWSISFGTSLETINHTVENTFVGYYSNMADTVKDKTSGAATYLNYGAEGITNPSWYAAWSGYELRAISPTEVRKGIGALGAISDGSYYGMASPEGSDNVWIRTTAQGIIPYQAGGAGSGHQYLGTSSWYFSQAYIDNIHSSNIYSANGMGADDTMFIKAEYSNEVNFGGTNNSSTIFFGYRAAGSKPIPTSFIFGGSTGTATVTASTFNGNLNGNANTASALTALTSNDNASSTATQRRIWFSYNDNTTGRPAYDDNFTYQSSTGTVTASIFKGSLNGNADTATLATRATGDGNGNTITSTYLRLDGGTMSGALNAHGGITLNSTTAQSAGLTYILGIKAFAEGGNIVWSSASGVTVGYAGHATTADTAGHASTADTAGHATTADTATTAYGVYDYAATTSVIKIGYSGSQLSSMNYLAAYGTDSSGGRVIKDVSATTVRTHLNVPTRTGGNASGTWSIDISGNAATATKLQTSRTVQTNLASTSTASFDGSANITPGVTGTLAVGNGGTGLTASPSMLTDLASTTAANVLQASPRPGVTGTLGVANGGTGRTAWGGANYPVYTSSSTALTYATSIYMSGSSIRPRSSGGASLGSTSYPWSSVHAVYFNATSDIRKKKDICEYVFTEDILSLPVYRFKYRDHINEDEHIGCMAQDLQKICPEIVHEDEEGYLSIEENKMIYLLLDKMKKMQKEIDALKEGKI